MDDKLLQAILAMDSYNQGYGARLARVDSDGNVVPYNQIATVTIIRSEGGTSTQDIGFYAIAYKDNSTNHVTVAYRGWSTPNLESTPNRYVSAGVHA